MGFIKCPRCELNYIREEEQYCSVCKREMRGEDQEELVELCSVCNENPVMPGKDVCYACYKEMNQNQDGDEDELQDHEQEDEAPREDEMDMDDVNEMEDVPMDDLSEGLPDGMGEQLSLEEEQSREEEEALAEEEEDE